MNERHRESGTITHVSKYFEDHIGHWLVSLSIRFESGGQNFVSPTLGKKEDLKLVESYINELKKLFHVGDAYQLENKKCYALRNYGKSGMGDDIVGLENSEGERFLIGKWLKQNFPNMKSDSAILKEKANIKFQIEYHKNSIKDYENQLENLEKNFIDWETHE